MAEPRRSDRSASEEARLAKVLDAIRRRADPDGFVPFDEFQAATLYAPGAGYYEAEERRLGVVGDFYTAGQVSPLFGETIADRLVAEFERIGRPDRFRVVEMGAGDGTLARTVLDALAGALPTEGAWEYVLVERSSALREQAIARLSGSAHARRVRLASALSSDGLFSGVVLANEFLDAQPTRRVRFAGGRWHELGVRATEGRFVLADGPLRPVVGPDLSATAPEGAILEFSPAAEGFLREVADNLSRGSAIVLDYGEEEPALLGRHPPGTLQAFRGHRVLEDPLDRPGSADLSTFVNFTRIRAAAVASGLVETAYGRQSDALGRWGFPARLDRALAAAHGAEEEVRLRLAAKNLLFGFDAFRVVEWTPRGAAPTT